jgi:glucan-binding YG repeat protein/beta-lactamase superfamily II metal-dependent hydrolase
MKKIIKKALTLGLCGMLTIGGLVTGKITPLQAAASAKTTIHFITINDNNDAILVENKSASGVSTFGMVDSGEDTDGPTSSTNGIVPAGNGYDTQVINYLKKAGVTDSNFVFYIGTHPHSDHIGTADTVIDTFKPARVYIQPYSNSYISSSANYWDNETVYNNMLAAADRVGATVIQTFNGQAAVDPMTITASGSINWADGADTDTHRPESLTLRLVHGTTTISTASASESSNWKFSFNDLKKRNDDGSTINYNDGSYSIAQDGLSADSYSAAHADGNIFEITNTHTVAATTTLSGSVFWDLGISEELIPSELTLQVQQKTTDWENYGEPLQVTKDGNWEFSVEVPSEDDSLIPAAYEYQVVITSALPSGCAAGGGTLDENNQYNLQITSSSQDDDAVQTFSDNLVPDTSMLEEAQSDSLFHVSPAAEDMVDPTSELDPANPSELPSEEELASLSTAAEAATASLTNRYTGNPDFYLGDTKIEIMNYGTSYMRYPAPDANYFSLGVRITSSNGHTAFLGGDINNYPNPGDPEDKGYDETKLVESGKFNGGVDVLKLNHHGAYGSNTPTYLKTMKPKIMVLTGSFNHVANHTEGSEIMGGTYSTVRELVQGGTKLYTTTWYAGTVGAIKINLNTVSAESLPNEEHFAYSDYMSTGFWLSDGSYTTVNGFKKYPKQGSSEGSKAADSSFYFENSAIPSSSKWVNWSNGYYYLGFNGAVTTGWFTTGDGYWYYANSNGTMLTGWQQLDDGDWYYMNSQGHMLTGKRVIDGATYYFFDNGKMALAQWVGSDYYGTNGALVRNYMNSNWKKDNTGYWYQYSDGSYPKDCWASIDGSWYYFNASGYRQSGWIKLGGYWYYLESDGKMVTSWKNISGKWYYLTSDGRMVTGWQLLDGTWYYFDMEGAMYTQGWHVIGTSWYYMNSNGALAVNTWIGNYYVNSSGAWIPDYGRSEWVKIGNYWKYRHSDGNYTTSSWELIDGQWYYFDAAGWMQTGWKMVNGNWYYMAPSGARYGEGWHLIGINWYYMYNSGAMAESTWAGNYYLGSSGAWIPDYGISKWIKSGSLWWYRHYDGSYTTSNWELINGEQYYFDSSGWMMTGWLQLNNNWYYLNSSGARLNAGWHWINGKCYYMYANGVMASNTWIEGYYVNVDGAWVP